MLFRFKLRPVPSLNAPATFQRTKEVILWPIEWQVSLVYLDDFIIFSAIKMGIHSIFAVNCLPHLQKAGVTTNIKKCKFFTKKIDTILGMLYGQESGNWLITLMMQRAT